MNLGMDTSTVAQNVQLALAPVFFLTAVAGMIAVVAGRLARIVDRARVVELALENASKTTEVEKNLRELRYLHLRGRLSNASIGLLTLCGFLIGLKSFVAAIIGGLASYPLAAGGAILVGLLESFSSFWASAFKDVIVFTLIIPVLMWRSLTSHHVEEEE